MEIPQKENMKFSKVKKLKGTGIQLVVSWLSSKKDSEEVFHVDADLKRTEPIHADLEDKFIRIKEMMLMCSGYAKLGEDAYGDMLNQIVITGISLLGDGDNEGVVISGIRETKTGKTVAIKSERIRFNANDYGFERDLRHACNDLCDEAFLHIFKNKTGTLTVF